MCMSLRFFLFLFLSRYTKFVLARSTSIQSYCSCLVNIISTRCDKSSILKETKNPPYSYDKLRCFVFKIHEWEAKLCQNIHIYVCAHTYWTRRKNNHQVRQVAQTSTANDDDDTRMEMYVCVCERRLIRFVCLSTSKQKWFFLLLLLLLFVYVLLLLLLSNSLCVCVCNKEIIAFSAHSLCECDEWARKR